MDAISIILNDSLSIVFAHTLEGFFPIRFFLLALLPRPFDYTLRNGNSNKVHPTFNVPVQLSWHVFDLFPVFIGWLNDFLHNLNVIFRNK